MKMRLVDNLITDKRLAIIDVEPFVYLVRDKNLTACEIRMYIAFLYHIIGSTRNEIFINKITKEKLSKDCGIKTTSVGSIISRLYKKGIVERIHKGVYKLVHDVILPSKEYGIHYKPELYEDLSMLD